MDDNRRSFLREQFDSILKDFISGVYVDESFSMQLQSKSLNKFQKWWCLFGKYWVIKNRYSNDDIKKMKWLMNGANHGMVDTCGENVSMMEQPICGNTHLTKSKSISNHSKLLKMELGQQISIKSPFKLKRDAVKRAQLNMRNRLAFNSSCWFV